MKHPGNDAGQTDAFFQGTESRNTANRNKSMKIEKNL